MSFDVDNYFNRRERKNAIHFPMKHYFALTKQETILYSLSFFSRNAVSAVIQTKNWEEKNRPTHSTKISDKGSTFSVTEKEKKDKLIQVGSA